MSQDHKYTAADFERYHSGKMSAGEMHALEKAAMEDPFLADALEGGQLGAVGLDVFPTEPPDCSHRIFKHPNLVCAPHLLGVSELAMDRIYRSMATDMVAVLQGRQPQFCVNPEVFV